MSDAAPSRESPWWAGSLPRPRPAEGTAPPLHVELPPVVVDEGPWLRHLLLDELHQLALTSQES